MNNEFIPFEQALALKELGFNVFFKDCYYDKKGELSYLMYHENFANIKTHCPAPLYQQAFRWFREKYRINPIITCYSELGNAWKYHIPNEDGEQGFNTYEEAELACLNKLIEICKNK